HPPMEGWQQLGWVAVFVELLPGCGFLPVPLGFFPRDRGAAWDWALTVGPRRRGRGAATIQAQTLSATGALEIGTEILGGTYEDYTLACSRIDAFRSVPIPKRRMLAMNTVNIPSGRLGVVDSSASEGRAMRTKYRCWRAASCRAISREATAD